MIIGNSSLHKTKRKNRIVLTLHIDGRIFDGTSSPSLTCKRSVVTFICVSAPLGAGDIAGLKFFVLF